MSSHVDEKIVKKLNKLGYTGLIILVLAYVYQESGASFLTDKNIVVGGANTTTSKADDPYYQVTKVTDGDTLHVLVSGIDEKVRLIGINTPETVDPRTTVQCFGKEASTRMKELADEKMVRLEYDDSQDLRDTYGRLLAYVYLEDGQMLNRKMLAEGYAYEYTYLTPYKYQTEFKELQNLAKLSSRGLWAENTCSGKK